MDTTGPDTLHAAACAPLANGAPPPEGLSLDPGGPGDRIGQRAGPSRVWAFQRQPGQARSADWPVGVLARSVLRSLYGDEGVLKREHSMGASESHRRHNRATQQTGRRKTRRQNGRCPEIELRISRLRVLEGREVKRTSARWAATVTEPAKS